MANEKGVTLKLDGLKAVGEYSKQLDLAIDKVGFNSQRSIMEEFTKFPKPPIDSGQLLQSVSYKKTGNARAEVSANKHYAKYVEYGTIRMEPRPFMRRGIDSAKKTNLQIIKDYLRKR